MPDCSGLPLLGLVLRLIADAAQKTCHISFLLVDHIVMVGGDEGIIWLQCTATANLALLSYTLKYLPAFSKAPGECHI
jgi:hypothetical protein